jgi:4-alpha-glucanotransferase
MPSNMCRDAKAVAAAREEHREAIELFVAEQYIFDKQWSAVKAGI